MAAKDDDGNCVCSWLDKAKALCLVIGAATTAICSITAAVFGALNHQAATNNGQAIQAVQTNLNEQDAATKDVKVALDKTHAETNAKLGSIEKKVDKAAKP
jgi:hypothetical protein